MKHSFFWHYEYVLMTLIHRKVNIPVYFVLYLVLLCMFNFILYMCVCASYIFDIIVECIGLEGVLVGGVDLS